MSSTVAAAPSSVVSLAEAEQNSVEAPGRSRLDGLDLLRGLSILAVILLHINIRVPWGKSPVGLHLPKLVNHVLVWNGLNGVIVFFAVSGFLITTMCLRRWGSLRDVSLPRFYSLRFSRIAPCLLALLPVLSLLHLARVPGYTLTQTSLPRALLAALTFHVNWLQARVGYLPPSWDVLWSLSVEEVFYLLFPLLCRWLKTWAFCGLLLGFVIVGPFARIVLTHNEIWIDHGYLSCMDAIALGCLAAVVAHQCRFGLRVLRGMQVAGAAMLVLIMVFNRLAFRLHIYQCGLDVPLLAIGTSLLAIACAQRQTRGTRWAAPLRWFGRNSYEIYLTHAFLVVGFVRAFAALGRPPKLVLPLYMAVICASGLLGAAVARYYSEPLNARLRRMCIPA